MHHFVKWEISTVNKTESVPKALMGKYEEITSITNAFSKKHLDEEYAQEIRFMVALLCRKRPSPLEKGKAVSWACGITHAIGLVNFLFDQNQSPHIKASDLYKSFGVGESTGQGKSKNIRDMLKMRQFDPNWTVPSKLSSSPIYWMLR